jgi:hypothetical protein
MILDGEHDLNHADQAIRVFRKRRALDLALVSDLGPWEGNWGRRGLQGETLDLVAEL